jgi:hypothetical protein
MVNINLIIHRLQFIINLTPNCSLINQLSIMLSRRRFIQQSSFSVMAIGLRNIPETGSAFSYESPYLKLQLLNARPELLFFSTDSLGKKQFITNPILKSEELPQEQYESKITSESIAYFNNSGSKHIPAWEFKMQPKAFTIHTQWDKNEKSSPLTITFAQKQNHCTVLGTMNEDNQMQFPCVLHFPGMGSFRVYCSNPQVTLFYDAKLTDDPFIKIALPSASSDYPDITYTFESIAVFPKIDKIERDERYDGFKKNFINIFQFSPGFKTLANNSTSDACAFTVFLYAEMARATPPLVKGLTAMDLIRNTLDRYLNGMLGYGMIGKPNWQSKYNSSDSFPSLVIAACYYISDTKDMEWAAKNYDGIRKWAMEMIATDTNNDGIIEYGYSGNAGSWDNKEFKRPANWWDTIGFGHDDAYSNALAYRALILLAKVAASLNKTDDSHYFNEFAQKLKGNYYQRFYNPQTKVLGGWRSEDGQLHDYYFTFVNSIAICYDLINKEDAEKIMQSLLGKMKEVGYTDFSLGLPGNLIPIADEDYAHHDKRWGYQNFQAYENGGATGCYVYYTIQALLKLNMRKEAEAILFPMLKSFKEGGFEGNCAGSNMTKDWKTWKGECWGYEGFLTDNYLALLAVSNYLAI